MGLSARSRRKLTILAGVAVVLAAGVAGLWVLKQQREASRVARSHEIGEAAFEAEDWPVALTNLSYYVGRHQDDADGVYKLAEARSHVPMENDRHVQHAIELAREAASLAPNDERPLRLLMRLYVWTGYLTELLDVTDRLLVLDPNDRDALEIRLQALSFAGRRDDAVKAAQLLVERFPDDAVTHAALIDQWHQAGRPPAELLAYANEQAGAHPDDAGFALLRTQVLIMAQDMPGARDSMLAATDLPIRDPDLLRRSLRVMDILAMDEEAEQVLTRCLAEPSMQLPATLVAAERAWKGGDPVKAAELLDPVRDRLVDADDESLGWSAFLDALAGRESGLGDALSERTGEEAEVWKTLIRATEDLRAGRAADVRRALAPLTATAGNNELVFYLLGEAEAALGETRAAVADLERATARDRRWLPVELRIVDLLLQLGDTEEAHRYAIEAQQMFRHRLAAFDALTRTSVALIADGKADDQTVASVVGLLEGLDAELPDSAVARARLARVYLLTGRTSEAEETIEGLLGDKRSVSAAEWLSLSALAERSGLASADRLAQRAESQDEGVSAALLERALRSAAEGRADEGKVLLREAVESSSGNEKAAARLMLASYLDRIDDADALPAYRSIVEDYPDNARVQLDVLRSRAAWRDQELIKAAIGRLHELTGETGVNWRVFEARRLLTFEGDDRGAAEAVDLLEKILARHPDQVDALMLAAEAVRTLGDMDRAAAYLKRAADAAPKNYKLRHSLVNTLKNAGRIDEARTEMKLALADQDISAPDRRKRIELLFELGMLDESLTELEALGDDAGPEDLITGARVLARLGRDEQADEYVTRALAGDSPGTGVIVAAAEHYAERGRMDLAEQTLDRLDPETTDEQRSLLLASFEERFGDADDADRRYEELARGVGGADVWATLARLRLARGDTDGSREAVEAGLRENAEHPRLRSLKTVLETLASLPKADELLRRALIGVATSDPGPEQNELLTLLRDRVSGAVDRETYLRRLERMTSASPTYMPPWSLLAYEMVADGRDERALELYSAAAEHAPLDPRPLRLSTELLRRLGRDEEAIASARAWRARTMDNPIDAELTLAALNAELGRWAEALRWCERWRDRIEGEGDRDPDLVAFLAKCLAANGRTDEAFALVGERGDHDPRWALLAAQVGGAIPDADEARSWVRRFGETIDGSVGARMTLGGVWQQLAARTGDPGDYEAEIEALSPIVRDESTGGMAAVYCALAYEARGEYGDAEQMYRVALELRPDDPVTMNNLAFVLVRLGRAGDALPLAQRAVSLLGDDATPALRGTLMDTLGRAQLETGSPGEAEATFRRARELRPDNAGLAVGLGEALAAQDKTDRLLELLPEIELLIKTANNDELTGRVEALREAAAE